jgi:hypothetical protein
MNGTKIMSGWGRRAILLLTIAIVMAWVTFPVPSHAQAAGAAGAKVESLALGGVSVDKEMKVLVYKQLLPGGKVYLTGKVSSPTPITGVGVSRDKGKTWYKAHLLDNGSFEYGFRPQAPAVYTLCIRLTDDKGTRTVIDSSCREVTVSEKGAYMLVRETLDKIVEAYEEKNIRLFLSCVSDDFFGDKTIFEEGVRNAERKYQDMDIRYSIDSVVPDYAGKIFVSLTFNRRYTNIGTGATATDSGSSSFILKLEDGQLKVLSMSKPAMFL